MLLPSPRPERLKLRIRAQKNMPRWVTGELVKTLKFTWKNWFALLGTGLLLGASAIGGGEWLVGPIRDNPAKARLKPGEPR